MSSREIAADVVGYISLTEDADGIIVSWKASNSTIWVERPVCGYWIFINCIEKISCVRPPPGISAKSRDLEPA
jgi:hypothetical protein